MGKIHYIVPDIQMRGNVRPCQSAPFVITIERAGGDRMTVAGGKHVAQPDSDIWMHLHVLGRFFSVHVRKRANNLLRIDFGGALRKLVQKPVLCSTHSAILLVNSGTLVTFAIIVVVHLREIMLTGIGLTGHALQHLLGNNIKHLRICKAQLCLVTAPHSAYFRKVLGVSLKVFAR